MMPSCITDAAACSAVDALKLHRIVDSCSAAAKRGRPASFCMLGEKNNLGDNQGRFSTCSHAQFNLETTGSIKQTDSATAAERTRN
jgi:hypothetical protein